MNSALCRILSGICLILCPLLNAQAAISNTSAKEIKGTEPYYKAIDWELNPIEGDAIVSWDVNSMGASSLMPGTQARIWTILMDDDGDIGLAKNYGKTIINSKTVGTYFTLIDPKTGLYRDIEFKELITSSSASTFPEKWYFVEIPYTWVGAQLGLELTAMTQYGNPSVGTTHKIDDPYKSDLVHIQSNDNPLISDSIIRIPPQVKVGIWDAADITKTETSSGLGKQQTIPTDPTPYNFPNITNSPQLGHTYKALIWEDGSNNDGKLGGFANGDIIVDQIGTKTFYTWKLVNGNQPANGTVTADTVITLVEKSTDNSITLPATNSEALKQWPGVGLPIGEAALQGFTLQVDIDWEFNLNDAPPLEAKP